MGIKLISNPALTGIEDRAAAEKILTNALEIAKTYESVSITDVKDLCGIPTYYTDNKYVWSSSDIRSENIHCMGDSYCIRFPEPTYRSSHTVPVENYTEDHEYTDPIYISIHTNDLNDPAEVIADVFKYAYTIKDRTVNISIM